MKKKSIHLILLSVLCAFVLPSCKKTAAFSTDKEEYTIGETVRATNNSEGGKSFIWTSTAVDEEARTRDFQFVASRSGKHVITLAVMSKKDRVKSEITKAIYVKAQFVFYTKNATSEGAELSIDGVYVGTLTQSYPLTEPGCGAQGCITKVLDDGEHEFSIKLPMGTYSYVADIYATQACNRIALN